MSAAAAILVRTLKVGRYECTLTFPPIEHGSVLAMTAEWSPDVPNGLSKADREAYRRGRNQALQELADLIGGEVSVVE